jgi:response regulator RpfG family c-di-GMP phosphodiesterase
VESHHEWFDGSGGYPKKLRGEEIPLGARILAVADAYDAMTCQRPHRPTLTTEGAAKVLKRGAGKQWDPVVVEAFLKKLEGGCQVPIAAFARILGSVLHMDGLVGTIDGKRLIRHHLEGSIEKAESLKPDVY